MSNDPDERAARLAEQLRANLRKRKQQARDKPSPPNPDAGDPAGD